MPARIALQSDRLVRSTPMSSYAAAGDYYDLLYAGEKDYENEVRVLISVLQTNRVKAGDSILDVGCATGEHARLLSAAGYAVDGIDLDQRFIEIAGRKNPTGHFSVANMQVFESQKQYDAVTCLFGTVGYARTEGGLRETVSRLASAARIGGTVLIEPWFEPGQLSNGFIVLKVGSDDETTVCRISRTVVDGLLSHLEFEYLIGRQSGIQRKSECHTLGLFTQAQMKSAIADSGFSVEHRPSSMDGRGLYVCRRSG